MDKNQEQKGDSLFAGRLHCRQYQEGYRFSVDAVLLAHFCQGATAGRVLDLGCGNGIISLILLYRWPRLSQLCAMELQPRLAGLTEENFAANGFSERARVICGDIREINRHLSAESFDSVVCNPPFFKTGHGRQSGNEEARVARHQLNGDLSSFLSAASYSLKNKGVAYLIYPADALTELVATGQQYNLSAFYLRPVYAYQEPAKPARLMLAAFRKNGGMSTVFAPPLYLYSDNQGNYSREMAQLYVQESTVPSLLL